MTKAARCAGIDLGASMIHAVTLTATNGASARVVAAHTFESSDLRGVVGMATDVDRIAIDAPDQLSTAPHRGDGSLTPKFRSARCGEIALGEREGIWVPWVTPVDPSLVPGWIQVGFNTWAALREAGHEPLEVYPAGVFRVLAGKVPPKKGTHAGSLARIALLEPHVELPEGIEMWTHDGLDALAAALVARWSLDGRARHVGHEASGCDSSAIWLPNVDQRARRDSNPQPSDP